MEEAKKKGLVVAVVGSAKDKAPELLVAEGLVKHLVDTIAQKNSHNRIVSPSILILVVENTSMLAVPKNLALWSLL